MSCCRCLLLLLAASPAVAAEGFMLGGGAESDSDGGISAAFVGSVGLAADTWLSAAVAKSSVDLDETREVEALYADLELDHFFDPVGVRASVAYWGDSDVLKSNDLRLSGYFRNDIVTFSADYEYRDFDLTIPPTDFFAGRRIMFDADGFGLTAQIQTSENTRLRLRGIKYDYSVDFRLTDRVEAGRLLSVTRLSLINSLVDHRAGISLGIDQGENNWNFELSTWESIFTGSRTRSFTIRYLLAASAKTDLEFGVGYDDSELYGDVSFFSFYLFFYGD